MLSPLFQGGQGHEKKKRKKKEREKHLGGNSKPPLLRQTLITFTAHCLIPLSSSVLRAEWRAMKDYRQTERR